MEGVLIGWASVAKEKRGVLTRRMMCSVCDDGQGEEGGRGSVRVLREGGAEGGG